MASISLIERVRVRSDWPLKRKVAWFALYVAVVAWAGLIILPHGP